MTLRPNPATKAAAALLLRLLAAACLLAPVAPPEASGQALWPGSRFTPPERARAVRRGLDFIYQTARVPSNFEVYGGDYLWCFYSVGASVSDPAVRRAARRMGFERAREWRRTHPRLPEDADAPTVSDYAFGSDAADGLSSEERRVAEG